MCLTLWEPPDLALPGEQHFHDFVAALGEAFVSFFTPEQMAAKLAAHGFTRREFLTPERAQADYFTPPRSGIPAPHRGGIVCAAT